MTFPWLAILLATSAALVGAVGTVLQQSEAAGTSGRGLGLLRALITRPRWLLGYGLGIVAVGLAAWALAVGSLLVVQPLGVTTLLFALPLAARTRGQRMTGSQWVSAVTLAVALAAFIGVGRPTEGDADQPFGAWLGVGAGALGLTAVLCQVASRRHGARRALPLGIATGLMFGVQGALTKAVLTEVTDGSGVLGALSGWELYALVIMAVASVSLQQLAFQAADLSTSQPATMILTPTSSAVCGIVIFGERLQTTPLGWGVVVAAVIAMTWATPSLAGATDPGRAVVRRRLGVTPRGGSGPAAR
jgi:drug/metabolite transporter (DMT)-like permease